MGTSGSPFTRDGFFTSLAIMSLTTMLRIIVPVVGRSGLTISIDVQSSSLLILFATILENKTLSIVRSALYVIRISWIVNIAPVLEKMQLLTTIFLKIPAVPVPNLTAGWVVLRTVVLTIFMFSVKNCFVIKRNMAK